MVRRGVAILGSLAFVAVTLLQATPASAAPTQSDPAADGLPPMCDVDAVRAALREAELEGEPSPSPSATASPSAGPSESPSATASLSATPSVSASEDPSPSSSPIESPSASASASPTTTPAPTDSAATIASSASASTVQVRTVDDKEPSASADATASPAVSAEPVIEESAAPTAAADPTVSASPSPSASATASASPEPSATSEAEESEAPVDVALCAMPVVNVAADAGLNQVRVSWVPGEVPAVEEDGLQPFGPADEYLVRVTGESERLVRSADASVVVSGLKNGVEYGFEVFALTAGGRSEGSGQVAATPSTGMEGVVAGLIVEFEPGSEQALGSTDVPGEDRVGEVELTVAEQVSDDAVLVELSEPVDLDTAERIAADLATDEQVAWAEPDEFFFTSSADDWNLTGAYGVDAFVEPDATRAGEGAGSTVAVIDTGITSHPDLEGRLVSGYDFVSSPEQLMASRAPNAPPVAFDGDYVDEATYGATGRDANPTDPGDWRDVAPNRASSWHGTQIAGVVGAVAPGASIQPVRALSWRGGLLSDIAAGITWASGGTVDTVPANSNPSKVERVKLAV